MRRKQRYVVVTGDLLGSSRLTERERGGLQKKVLAALAECNERFSQDIVAPFTIVAGDEFQGLLKSVPASLDVVGFLQRALHPHVARFGVGCGGMSTQLYESTGPMDGECFHRSRAALTRAEKEKAATRYDTGNEFADTAVNSILDLTQAIQQDWKPLHHRRFRLYEQYRDLQKVAEKDRVSKAAVGKSLKRAKYQAVLTAGAGVRRLLSTLTD
jgi:hypothetical protein